DLFAVCNEKLAPARRQAGSFRRELILVANGESVANGDEGGSIEQPRPDSGDVDEQIAIAEWPVVLDGKDAREKVAGFQHFGDRLDIRAVEMRADDHRLHLRPVRMTASTFASTILRPRYKRSTSPMEMVASPAMTTPRSSRWSSVSRSVISSFLSAIRRESVRRPWAGQRKRHAIGFVTAAQLVAKLLQPGLFIAIEEHVDLRKPAAALQSRFGDRVAGELLHHHLL